MGSSWGMSSVAATAVLLVFVLVLLLVLSSVVVRAEASQERAVLKPLFIGIPRTTLLDFCPDATDVDLSGREVVESDDFGLLVECAQEAPMDRRESSDDFLRGVSAWVRSGGHQSTTLELDDVEHLIEEERRLFPFVPELGDAFELPSFALVAGGFEFPLDFSERAIDLFPVDFGEVVKGVKIETTGCFAGVGFREGCG